MPILNAVFEEGLLADRPAADAPHEGYYWFASDVNGGTLFQCKDGVWIQIAPGVTLPPAGYAGGDLHVTGFLTVDDDVAVAGSEAIGGDSGITGNQTVGGNVSAGGGISANGSGTFGGDLSTGGQFTASKIFIPSSGVGAPSSGAHFLRELYADNNGTLWVCIAAGTPGTWFNLGAVGATGATGATGAPGAAGGVTPGAIVGASTKPLLNFVPLTPALVRTTSGLLATTSADIPLPVGIPASAVAVAVGMAITGWSSGTVSFSHLASDTDYPLQITYPSHGHGIVPCVPGTPCTIGYTYIGVGTIAITLVVSGYWEPV